MNRVFLTLVLLAGLAGCKPNLDGEYHATREVLFFTQEATLIIQGEQATFKVNIPGSDNQATDSFNLKHGDGQIALFKPEKPDDQLIFNIEDEGKRLVYVKTSEADFPEVWTKKVKI